MIGSAPGRSRANRQYPGPSDPTPIVAFAGRQYSFHNLNPRRPLARCVSGLAPGVSTPRQECSNLVLRASGQYPTPSVGTPGRQPIHPISPRRGPRRPARITASESGRQCHRSCGVRDAPLACVRGWWRSVWRVARVRAQRAAYGTATPLQPTGHGCTVANSSATRPIPIPPFQVKDTIMVDT